MPDVQVRLGFQGGNNYLTGSQCGLVCCVYWQKSYDFCRFLFFHTNILEQIFLFAYRNFIAKAREIPLISRALCILKTFSDYIRLLQSFMP